MSLISKEMQEKIDSIDVSKFIAAPAKIIRPCCVCGQIKVAAAVGKEDNDLSICRNCMLEVGKADLAHHLTADKLLVGDFCDLCQRRQSTSTYSWNGKKVKTCSECSGHFYAQLNPGPI